MRTRLAGIAAAQRWTAVACVTIVSAVAALAVALYAISTRQSDIQESRALSVLTTCREQNARHDATVAALDRVLTDASKDASPARLEQIRQSRPPTLLLIDALAPKRDCVRRTERLVGELPD